MLRSNRTMVALTLLMSGVAYVGARAQESDAQKQIIKVVPLNHAEANSVEQALHALGLPVSLAHTDENQVLVRGLAPSVNEVIELIHTHLDVPSLTTSSKSAVTEFIPLGTTPTKTLMPSLQAVVTSRFSQLAIDRANGMLVVRAQPDELAAVHTLLDHTRRPVKALLLNFFFIRADIGSTAKPGSVLPTPLQPIATTLAQNGFGNLTMMAPITVSVDESLEFETESNLHLKMKDGEVRQSIGFTASGKATLSGVKDDKTVQLSIFAQAKGDSGADKGPGRTYFELRTTVATVLGNYVLLAAAPSSTADGEAMALVVRATTP